MKLELFHIKVVSFLEDLKNEYHQIYRNLHNWLELFWADNRGPRVQDISNSHSNTSLTLKKVPHILIIYFFQQKVSSMPIWVQSNSGMWRHKFWFFYRSFMYYGTILYCMWFVIMILIMITIIKSRILIKKFFYFQSFQIKCPHIYTLTVIVPMEVLKLK